MKPDNSARLNLVKIIDELHRQARYNEEDNFGLPWKLNSDHKDLSRFLMFQNSSENDQVLN